MKVTSKFKKKYPWIFKSIILTPILALFAILTVGAEGYGIKFFYQLLFPYPFFVIAGFQIEDDAIMAIIGFIGFLLYVFYGVILTIAERKGKLKDTSIILIITHIAAALFCIFLLP